MVNDVAYGPAGEMTDMKFLLPGGGYYTEARTYNERLQLRTLTATGAGAPSVNLEYRYSATQNNGQITQMKDWISGEEVTYQYDLLSRLTSAVTTGPEWGLSFTYDGFGNKTQQTVTKGSGPNFSAAVDGLTNRFVGAGYSYDANGNLTSMGTYDVANRLQGSGNVYGPRNERIMKGGSGEVNFYSPDGRRMGAYQMMLSYGVIAFNQIRTNVYFAGKLIREANEAVVLDRLGSVRVRGSQTMNYYPYGEERTTTANNYNKFGTYFRDEPGLDYADQRYYSNVQGRFLTADPYGGSAAPTNPQSWNRYSYVSGDPINANDPTGLLTILVHGSFNQNPEWTDRNSDFAKAVAETFGEQPVPFIWSGNGVTAFTGYYGIWAGGFSLANEINRRQFQPGEKLNIVAHSHGGNVVKIASSLISRKIDNLVNLGTPVNWDLWRVNRLNITNYCNVSSFTDEVQFYGASPDQIYATALYAAASAEAGFYATEALFRGNFEDWLYYLKLSAYYASESTWYYLSTKLDRDARNFLFLSGSHGDLHTVGFWNRLKGPCGLTR